MTVQRDWKFALREQRGIVLHKVEYTVRRARGIVVDWQIDRVLEFRDESLRLYSKGKVLASMWAGQAMFEAANGLHGALEDKKPLQAGRKVVAGGKSGAAKTNGVRSEDAKRVRVIAEMKAYKGAPRNMASIVAKRADVTARYVRQIREQTLP